MEGAFQADRAEKSRAHDKVQVWAFLLQAAMTPIEKLTKLRDSYKQAGKLVEAKAVQRAIDVLRK